MKTNSSDALQALDTQVTFEAISDERLAEVQGGGAGIGYGVGWVAGQAVTRAIAPFNQDKAFTQVGGPFLRNLGFPNAANGAEAAVREVAEEYNHPVKASR